MTECFDRKAYVDDTSNLSSEYPNDFVYISMDVNGLKVVNDSLGHEAGDEIIIGASQCMLKSFNKYGKVYRTGGDEFTIIMDVPEQTKEKGFAENSISEWLRSFGKSGQVHEEDIDDYLRYTNIDYMRDYFAGNKTSLHIFYRRKYGDEFKQVMMEIIPADDYSNDNQSLFLYVNNIERAS